MRIREGMYKRELYPRKYLKRPPRAPLGRERGHREHERSECERCPDVLLFV